MSSVKLLFLLFSIVVSLNVVLTFDDARLDHYQVSLDLDSKGVKGTFYVNSNRVGESDRLSLPQLSSIAYRGHEIGGHTMNHANLSSLAYAQQFTEVCGDRDRLLSWGFNTTNFAYPFGLETSASYDILSRCGYNGARDSGGIRGNSSCTSCPKSDSIPPLNPQLIRSISYRSSMGVSGLQWYVQNALNDPLYADGFIAFVFHEYGNYSGIDSAILPR